MKVQLIAAFSQGERGGNPAGVVLCETLPEPERMQAIATEVGYSETVFAAPQPGGYRVRYFAPEAEIPFCGHATIALGAALANEGGSGSFILELNAGQIMVHGRADAGVLSAAFQSPPTRNEPAPKALRDGALRLFGLTGADIDERLPAAIIEAGARHLFLALRERQRLAAMSYEMAAGAELMLEWRLATISLVYAETSARYHARNPFAGGGVYEDPATGAAAAAVVAYLHDLGITGGQRIEIVQGEDMGVPCLLHAEAPTVRGGSARVHGSARLLAIAK
ncbi:MAG TPA: PhzF family phenazine biosynthesis protein [Sphingobium sp.]|nr:PhzF family phenazine biosynthesis protein [Sphingobium sp.]